MVDDTMRKYLVGDDVDPTLKAILTKKEQLLKQKAAQQKQMDLYPPGPAKDNVKKKLERIDNELASIGREIIRLRSA